MENIVIFGSSGHAKVVIDIVEKENRYKIIGLIDSYAPKGNFVSNYEILGTENDMPQIVKERNVSGGIIAIGDNFNRYEFSQKVKTIQRNFKFLNAIHPTAIIGNNVEIGSGVVVMAGAIINSDCEIGDFCIINTKASLDHESLMEEFSSLGPGVTTGGKVKIGRNSAILIGATLSHSITIGDNTVIGGGSFVRKSIPENVLAYGVPAKIISIRAKNDKYF